MTVLQGAGPPKTGKSMAAEVIAADLGGRRRTGHGGRLAGSDDVEADNAVNEEKTGSESRVPLFADAGAPLYLN